VWGEGGRRYHRSQSFKLARAACCYEGRRELGYSLGIRKAERTFVGLSLTLADVSGLTPVRRAGMRLGTNARAAELWQWLGALP